MIKQCFNPRSLGGYSRCSLRSAACREIDAFVEFLARGQYEDAADTERSRIRLQAVAGNIQAFIEHNYMDDISLQTVAEAMNYSDAYFCKI